MKLLKFIIALLAIGFFVETGFVLISSYNQPETVYPNQSTRECDSAFYWKSERLEWAIATADMILMSQGVDGVAELIAEESYRYPDSVLQEMNYSRKAEEAKQKRIKTGRVGKSYGDQSVEE